MVLIYPRESRARKLLLWADNPGLGMLREPNKGVYKGLQRNTDFISIISNRCARSYCAPNLKIVLSDRLFIVITN